MTEDDSGIYQPANLDRWLDDYYVERIGNDPIRQEQFEIDSKLISRYAKGGNLCDVGCSTGEFVRTLQWEGSLFGMEINESAIAIAKDIINFEKNIYTDREFFDAVVFRGTIQHVDEPFRMIKAAYASMRPGGHIFFIATPNINSLLYRVKKNLPMLDWPRNYYLPGDSEFVHALTNFGFSIKEVQYPYLGTPYAKPIHDIYKFLRNLTSKRFYPHPFWGSMMNVVARKI